MVNDKPVGKKLGWNTTSSKIIFESPWHKIRQDKIDLNGKDITYTYMEHPGAVFIVPVTKAHEIVLIKTYRYTLDEWCWEVPAGGVGDKPGRSLETIARDEMYEEAGCSDGTLKHLGFYYSANGVMRGKIDYFLAENVTVKAENKLEDTESISEINLVPMRDISNQVYSGRIRDGESAFAILLALNALGPSSTR